MLRYEWLHLGQFLLEAWLEHCSQLLWVSGLYSSYLRRCQRVRVLTVDAELACGPKPLLSWLRMLR